MKIPGTWVAFEAETKVISDPAHLPLIGDSLRKNVLVRVVPRRAVDIQDVTLLVAARKPSQKVERAFSVRVLLDRGFKQASRPEDAPLGAWATER